MSEWRQSCQRTTYRSSGREITLFRDGSGTAPQATLRNRDATTDDFIVSADFLKYFQCLKDDFKYFVFILDTYNEARRTAETSAWRQCSPLAPLRARSASHLPSSHSAVHNSRAAMLGFHHRLFHFSFASWNRKTILFGSCNHIPAFDILQSPSPEPRTAKNPHVRRS